MAARVLNRGEAFQLGRYIFSVYIPGGGFLERLDLVGPVMATAGPGSLMAMRETIDVLLEISKILNTGLDADTLTICVRLCEQGINPEALSSVIKELRKATESLKASENMTS